jgi:hypothetical protein
MENVKKAKKQMLKISLKVGKYTFLDEKMPLNAKFFDFCCKTV